MTGPRNVAVLRGKFNPSFVISIRKYVLYQAVSMSWNNSSICQGGVIERTMRSGQYWLGVGCRNHGELPRSENLRKLKLRAKRPRRMSMKQMRSLRTFSCLVAVVLLGLTTQALGSEHDDLLTQGLGFHFVSLSGATDEEGVPHGLFMTGNGTFNDRHVAGGGFFNDAVGGFPVSTGSCVLPGT